VLAEAEAVISSALRRILALSALDVVVKGRTRGERGEGLVSEIKAEVDVNNAEMPNRICNEFSCNSDVTNHSHVQWHWTDNTSGQVCLVSSGLVRNTALTVNQWHKRICLSKPVSSSRTRTCSKSCKCLGCCTSKTPGARSGHLGTRAQAQGRGKMS
jgi:hypothetical protein